MPLPSYEGDDQTDSSSGRRIRTVLIAVATLSFSPPLSLCTSSASYARPTDPRRTRCAFHFFGSGTRSCPYLPAGDDRVEPPEGRLDRDFVGELPYDVLDGGLG